MDSINNNELMNNLNALNLVFYEAREVNDFYWHGKNRLTFNRFFVVLDENIGENSWIKLLSTNEKLTMKANHIYFMSCDTELEFSFAHNVKFLSFHFNIFLSNLYDLFINSNKISEIYIGKERIENLYRFFHSAEISKNFELKNYLSAEIVKLLPKKLIFQNNNHNHYSIRLFEYIKNNLSAQLTINEIANHLSMNVDTLSRKFRIDFDNTLKEVIKRRLSASAEHLLMDPNLLIKNVAFKLKFTNEYYFSKFFKRETGMTPSEFRSRICASVKSNVPDDA